MVFVETTRQRTQYLTPLAWKLDSKLSWPILALSRNQQNKKRGHVISFVSAQIQSNSCNTNLRTRFNTAKCLNLDSQILAPPLNNTDPKKTCNYFVRLCLFGSYEEKIEYI